MISLSASRVQQIVTAEHGLRTQTFPLDIVRKIYRFGAPVGHSIEMHGEAPRCMDLARQDIINSEQRNNSFHSGKVHIAERLTGGKGRFKRRWHAPEGGIWLVLVLVNTMLNKYARLLPLAAGVACCESVRHFGVPAHIKWVNDVHVEGKKIAGILMETMLGPTTKEEYVLMGIGLNVNNTIFPEEIARSAAGMREYLPENLQLSQVAAVLIAKLAWNFGLLCYQEQTEMSEMPCGGRGVMSPVIQAWTSMSDTIGRRVRYGFNVVSEPQYLADAVGLADSGALIMRLPDGREIIEAGGEIVYLD